LLGRIAAEPTDPDRMPLFCFASDSNWQAASIAWHRAASRFAPTEQGRAVLAALHAKRER